MRESELSSLNASITKIEAELQNLVERRNHIAEDLESHKALISPARRLPSDLILEIFLFCLPTDRYPSFTPSEAPLLLGAICSGWRQIALHSPRLWSEFAIMPSYKPSLWRQPATQTYRPQIVGVEEWLKRSGELPLNILLSAYGRNSFETTLLDCILHKSVLRRWKNVHLDMHSRMHSALAAIKAEDVPLLESISFA